MYVILEQKSVLEEDFIGIICELMRLLLIKFIITVPAMWVCDSWGNLINKQCYCCHLCSMLFMCSTHWLNLVWPLNSNWLESMPWTVCTWKSFRHAGHELDSRNYTPRGQTHAICWPD